MGPPTVLTDAEEQLLVNRVIANAKKGIPLKRSTLIQTVQEVIEGDGRDIPFTNGTPGRTWLKIFMSRHPEISEKTAEEMNKARANVTEEDLRKWFVDVQEFLEQEGCADILLDPTRIYNADESGFQTCPKTGKVLGPTGFNNMYEVKSGNTKENITVLANFSGSGDFVPPMIVSH